LFTRQKTGDCWKIFPEFVGNKNRQIPELFSDNIPYLEKLPPEQQFRGANLTCSL